MTPEQQIAILRGPLLKLFWETQSNIENGYAIEDFVDALLEPIEQAFGTPVQVTQYEVPKE